MLGKLLKNRGEPRDPAIAEIADRICGNLRRLGLHVSSAHYGAFFVEIRASTSPELVTTPGDRAASGVALLLAGKYDPPTLVFEQINSRLPGLGGRMVDAAIEGLRAHPGAFTRVRVNDLSPFRPDGRRWWAHVAERRRDIEWLITNDPDSTHWPAPAPQSPVEPVETSAAFVRRRAKLHALAREFGHDPSTVTLSPARRTFPYLGQNFTSEGEATPDGRVVIYYDPEMSDARLGCCLAHELQHLRYFVLRAAFAAERADGPLHRRFARFTPELLASQRGVSAYSNEHWDAWAGAGPPRLFSDELSEGGSEPINETIAEAAKALYNWGPDSRINPVWRALREAVDEEYWRLMR